MGVKAEAELVVDAGGVKWRNEDWTVGGATRLGRPAFSYLPDACGGPLSTRFHRGATSALLYNSAAP